MALKPKHIYKSGTPSDTPDFVGQRYTNTSNGTVYTATNTTSSGDWEENAATTPTVPSNTGFVSGGYDGTSATNHIDKFSFSSNVTADDHGDLTTTFSGLGSAQTADTGFKFTAATLDTFSFTSSVNATNHGDIITTASSNAYGWSATDGFAGHASFGGSCSICKFSLSSITTASSHGTIPSGGEDEMAGAANSSTDGHTMGSWNGGATTTRISKYAFSSNSTGASHGNLAAARNYSGGGTYNSTDGFMPGGAQPTTLQIDKFNFASNTTAVDHGDLTAARGYQPGTSSATEGFVCGGYTGSASNIIDKFTFASSGNATDHGDLVVARWSSGAHGT